METQRLVAREGKGGYQLLLQRYVEFEDETEKMALVTVEKKNSNKLCVKVYNPMVS